MLDPGFLAIIFLVSACVLTSDLMLKGHGCFMSKSENFLVDSLCAEAIEAVKSHTVLLASSSTKLISIVILNQRHGFETVPSPVNFSVLKVS